MDNIAQLLRIIADNTQPPPSPAEVLECLKANPGNGALALAWLRRTAADGMLYDQSSRREIALFASTAMPVDGDRQLYVLSDLIEGYETDENFYPTKAEDATPQTADAIDRFLEKYAGSDGSDRETAALEQMILNPVADYGAVLAMEEEQSLPGENEAKPGSNDDLLNRFIRNSKAAKEGEKDSEQPGYPAVEEAPAAAPPAEVVNAEKPEPIMPPPIPDRQKANQPCESMKDTSFSESLAKIYIKRKNYSGAHEIISKLNLKYPEKSVYFAVQLRFLEKVILNEELKAKAKTSALNN